MPDNKTISSLADDLQTAFNTKMMWFEALWAAIKDNPEARKAVEQREPGILSECETADKGHRDATEALLSALGNK